MDDPLLSGNESKPDPFSVEAMALDDDYVRNLGVERILTHCKVGKPAKQLYFRIRADEDEEGKWSVATILFQDFDKRLYYIAPYMREYFVVSGARYMIYTGTERQGEVFLWPVRLAGADGNLHRAHEEQHRIANMARESWVRMEWADAGAGGYITEVAQDQRYKPCWPKNTTFSDLLRLGFKDHYIDSEEHPIYKRLIGLT